MQIAYDQAALDNLACSRERLRAVLADGGVAVEPGGQLAPIRPGASVHHGGTIRMHESPAYGALDGRGRLHEVPNVAVGDASAFTTGPEKNPTLTAMALAGRAATLLAADLRAGRIG
jgi:choline dehydrogenase-like flavoprotein